MNGDKIGSLASRTPPWVPEPEPHIEGVRRRVRRRRTRRYAVAGAVAVLLVAGLVLPLSGLAVLHRGHTGGGFRAATRVQAYGVGLELPNGWSARYLLSPGVGPYFLINNHEPTDTSTLQSGAKVPVIPSEHLPVTGRDSIAIGLFEYPPQTLQPDSNPFVRTRGPISIPPEALGSCEQNQAACFHRAVSLAGRDFYLVGTISTVPVGTGGSEGIPVGPSARVVPTSLLNQLNAVLARFSVGQNGYRMGAQCRYTSPARLSVPPGDRPQFSSQCLSGTPLQPTHVRLSNRLTTTSGQRASLLCAFTIYKSALPPPYERDNQVVFNTNALGDLISWGKPIRLTIPALPAGLYYFTCHTSPGLQGSFLVGG